MSTLRSLGHRGVRKHGHSPPGTKQSHVSLVPRPEPSPYSVLFSAEGSFTISGAFAPEIVVSWALGPEPSSWKLRSLILTWECAHIRFVVSLRSLRIIVSAQKPEGGTYGQEGVHLKRTHVLSLTPAFDVSQVPCTLFGLLSQSSAGDGQAAAGAGGPAWPCFLLTYLHSFSSCFSLRKLPVKSFFLLVRLHWAQVITLSHSYALSLSSPCPGKTLRWHQPWVHRVASAWSVYLCLSLCGCIRPHVLVFYTLKISLSTLC